MTRQTTRIARLLSLAAVVIFLGASPVFAAEAQVTPGAEESPAGVTSDHADPARADTRAFVVGVDPGGASILDDCPSWSFCPAACFCYDGDFPFCGWANAECNKYLCQILGCPPRV